MGGFQKKHGIRVLAVVLCTAILGFGAGMAQSDIFLRKDRGEEASVERERAEPKRRGIFLRRNLTKKNDRVRSRVNYGTRVAGPTLAERSNAKALRNLDAWQAYGGKPQTAQQVLSFAAAYRAPNQAIMLEERARVSAEIEARNQARLDRFKGALAAAGDFGEEDQKGPQVASLQRGNAAAGEDKPKGNIFRRIFRKSSDILDKPRRVFRDYR